MTDYSKYDKAELLKIVERQEKELKAKKYGLVWDSEREPEQVVLDCENKLPILKRVKKKEIRTDDSEDNILIEGDNYHALTVLNYTHKEKIDVIYIDPPYNTGEKDFIYNDRYVDKEDGYRHSKWLNFMKKRLNLAKELLKKDGILFISIDDNEIAQLKLLSDSIFHQENFIAILPRLVKKGGKSSGNISKNNDYVLVYFNSKDANLNKLLHSDSGFKNKDKHYDQRGYYKLNQTLDYDSIQYSKSLDYKIHIDGKSIIPGGVSSEQMKIRQENNPKRDFCWRWSKKRLEFGLKEDFIVLKKHKNKPPRIYTKTYQNATIVKNDDGNYFVDIVPRKKPLSTIDLINNLHSNDNAKKELKNFFGEIKFDYPKPTNLINVLLRISTKSSSVVLDFMAGSGTTGHAVLQLNKEDGGNRKFILCTNNENNICTDVTYPRVEKVIRGYKKNGNGDSVDGLGGNLQYFKTDLVKKTKNRDQVKINLTKKCTEMLCVKENIFNLDLENKDFKIFSSNKKDKFLCVYYNFIDDTFNEFLEEIKKLKNEKTIYMFSMENKIEKNLFKGIMNCKIEAIPQNILDVYKQLVKMNIPIKTNVIFTDLNKAKTKIFTEKDKDDGARVLRIVLEKVIQKISQDNSISILNNKGKEEKINSLNDKLFNQKIITKIEYVENRVYLTIGNNAAHGDYEDYDLKKVENFYKHIQSLLDSYSV